MFEELTQDQAYANAVAKRIMEFIYQELQTLSDEIQGIATVDIQVVEGGYIHVDITMDDPST